MIDPKIRKNLESAQDELENIDLKLSSLDLDSNSIKELSKKRAQISELVEDFKRIKELEGLVVENEKLAEKARYLTTQAKDDPIQYIHHEVGYNFRLTNIQAAMGVAQLEKLEAIGGINSIVPSEGIVFKYQGKTYKFTGAFAPVNQITGLISF